MLFRTGFLSLHDQPCSVHEVEISHLIMRPTKTSQCKQLLTNVDEKISNFSVPNCFVGSGKIYSFKSLCFSYFWTCFTFLRPRRAQSAKEKKTAAARAPASVTSNVTRRRTWATSGHRTGTRATQRVTSNRKLTMKSINWRVYDIIHQCNKMFSSRVEC